MHELKPGGASIIVTEENKREYVKLYVNYRFMRGIEQQFMSLQKGMYLTSHKLWHSWILTTFICFVL